MTKKDSDVDSKQGVQAAETVLQVLTGFIDAEPMPMLKTLADKIGMHPAKVHRYLVSLSRMGFVEQDAETSRYRLGPLSLRLGFAAISTVDCIRVAKPMMHVFCEELGQTVLLAIWNNGPTIALKESAPGLIVLTAMEGTVLPILSSAIGRAFGAWMPREKVASLIENELLDLRTHPVPGCPTSLQEAETLFDEIRKRGLARTTGERHIAFHALSAPVFYGNGDVAAVLCTVGTAGQFDTTWSGTTAKTLRTAASRLSSALGYTN
ncbi:IclR family transcriptional regulator [Paraburkholderia sediminicola]